MSKECILAPGIYKPPQWAHAVKVGDLIYTSGATARDKDGSIVGKGDLAAQTEQTFRNLDAALKAAGASWSEVVKAYFYWPTSRISDDQWKRHRAIRDRYLPPYQYAGVGASMDLLESDMLLEVELVAHIGGPKHPIINVPGVYAPPGWAHAVRVGSTLYVSGQQPLDPTGRVVARGDTVAQTRAVYRNLDAVLKAAGASWNDVVRVNQYVTREDGMAPMREGRKDFLPRGKALSTSVRCNLSHPDAVIQVGMEAFLDKRQTYTSPEVWQVPGTVQAARTGNVVYLQGQVPCDKQGEVVGPGDIRAQAEQLYKNAGAMLKAAGATWGDVVHVRSYTTRREYFTQAREARHKHMRPGQYAATGLLAGFFTPHSPDMLLEVEFIAVTG